MRLEGIIAKRRDLGFRSGLQDLDKNKEPACARGNAHYGGDLLNLSEDDDLAKTIAALEYAAARRGFDRRDNDLQNSAAPTVNITIGRVEVRAEARAPQPLGLDEYLKRRSAG